MEKTGDAAGPTPRKSRAGGCIQVQNEGGGSRHPHLHSVTALAATPHAPPPWAVATWNFIFLKVVITVAVGTLWHRLEAAAGLGG